MTATMIDRPTAVIQDVCAANAKQAFGHFPSGVVAVGAMLDGSPAGFAASSFTTVSWEPALVSICVQRNSKTWAALSGQDRIGISVLSERQGELAFQLSSRNRDRFAGLDWEPSDQGALFIGGAVAWMDCSVYQEIPAGDHSIVIFKVHGLGTAEESPLVYHRQTVRKMVTA
ncbi:flavin reductase family protein [Arthrobacter methylotrophus]|uniref:Flavin reductase family protein n=1 Tax=Arthrobacter methylotrophus TaxID=121291 RepID=A0ABV5UM60_9MICC